MKDGRGHENPQMYQRYSSPTRFVVNFWLKKKLFYFFLVASKVFKENAAINTTLLLFVYCHNPSQQEYK